MKQNITREQFNELSLPNQKKLFKFYFPKVLSDSRSNGTKWAVVDINPEFLTIGRLIEFLDEEYSKGNKFSLSIERVKRAHIPPRQVNLPH